MKENSIEEDITRVKQRIEDVKEYIEYGLPYSEYLDLENSFDNILSDYKRVLKENEELKQEKINNYKMIALAQNEALGYMQGYEDGKKLKTSAIASIVENQQYYIIKKQVEKYEEHIEKLQKKNEELKLKNKTLEELLKGNLYESYKYYKELAGAYQGNCISVQKVKDKIEKEIKYHEKNILDIETITMLKGKTVKEEAEIEFNKYAIVVLKKMLQELLEGRKRNVQIL